MVRQGANVIQLTDALFLGEWVPDAAILQAPYLMDKPDDFRKILGSEWLEDLNKRLAAKNIKRALLEQLFRHAADPRRRSRSARRPISPA